MRVKCHTISQMERSPWRGGAKAGPSIAAVLCVPRYTQRGPLRRNYVQPANLSVPVAGTASRRSHPHPPLHSPAPAPLPQIHQVAERATIEDGHSIGEAENAAGPFDQYLAKIAQSLQFRDTTSVPGLYTQYRERAGRMCSYVVPYEERPAHDRRADVYSSSTDGAGDGVVMVVHALLKPGGEVDKICACSGFVIDAQSSSREKCEGEVVITCAHTLEEMRRSIETIENGDKRTSLSFVVPSNGSPRLIKRILSSMPRSDTIAIQLEPADLDNPKWRSLPLSPFPADLGVTVLTHLFGATDVPKVLRSQSRLPPVVGQYANIEEIETPTRWLDDQAWRRWGAGNMLGYRSYTNIEVEAGIHSSLPHILTSILPSPGSSGGPLVNAETGAVVGMISGRRMDNRVEGERGWGASSESIFEMFSLPGFTPTARMNN